MPKYSVTKTETAEVWANDEAHAETVANEEFGELPNATYEVTRLTPVVLAELNAVSLYLEAMGFEGLWIESPHFTSLKQLHIGIHQVENYEGNQISCPSYYLFGNSSDGENWDGTGWQLLTCELEEVASLGNLNSLELAGRIAYNIGRADFDLESRGETE
jgi:hypothetical protein